MFSVCSPLPLFAQSASDPLRSLLPPWVTPIWILCLGILFGLLACLMIYGVLRLASREAGQMAQEVALEGLLKPVFYLSLIPAFLAVALLYFAPAAAVLKPLWPTERFSEFDTNQDGKISSAEAPAEIKESFEQADADLDGHIDPQEMRSSFGRFSFWLEEPFTKMVLVTAALYVVLFLLTLSLRAAFPKVAAVALTTAKEGVAQPLFWVCIAAGTFLLLLFIWIPYNTFGEDIKMLKQQGLDLLMLIALLLAVATASVSVSQEIEGRTALTVLSKPIGRRQFIIGKFLGVVAPVFLLFLVLGFIYLCTVSYKVVYDAWEGGVTGEVTAGLCGGSMAQTIPALVLKFIGAMCMAAISVALSTRLPMLANMSVCFAVFIVGHLVPLLVPSLDRKFEIVKFMGQLIGTVLPGLVNFDVQAGIAGDQFVPVIYLLHATVYGLLYCVFMLCGALYLFEDRDLA